LVACLYAAAAALAETVEEARLLGMIQQNRGVLANMHGDFATANELYTKSLEAFEKAQDAEPLSGVLNNLGMLRTKTGNFREAREYFARALEIARQRGFEPPCKRMRGMVFEKIRSQSPAIF